MGIADHFIARREELIRQYFEPQLARLDLSVSQIEKQTIEELNQSLEKVNDAISHPDSFGTLNLKATADAGLFAVTAREAAHISVAVLPLLLERKSLILSRIKTLIGSRKIDSLADLVASVADQNLRQKIESELSIFTRQSYRLAEQESSVAQVQAEQITIRDEAVAKLQTELFERRLRAWTGFFAKESVATYIGAFLLITLTFVHVMSMFNDAVRPSEIVNNSYLLILGYFFGQSVVRTSSTSQQQN